MKQYYRVMDGQAEDKKIDLVLVMRRIRSGKITATTPLCVDDDDTPTPAGEINELQRFFYESNNEDSPTLSRRPAASLGQALKEGWQFVVESSVVTAIAGGFITLVAILTLTFTSQFGVTTGGTMVWAICMMMQQFYFIFLARSYRGQTMGDDFMNRQLAPILLPLILFSLIYALLVGIGLVAAILPGLIIAALLSFTPLILMDKQLPLLTAIRHSIQMSMRTGMKGFISLMTIHALHFICLMLIIPVPLTMPILMAALCEMYEKKSS